MQEIILGKIDSKYCDYLRKYDFRVSNKTFTGIIFEINNIEYFAPLCSPKPKHKKLKNIVDIVKIEQGNLGVLNINNMVPVSKCNYIKINLEKIKKTDIKYYYLLINQIKWLNANYIYLEHKCFKLYTKYINNELSIAIRNRCCNFPLLEEKCLEYKEEVPN